MAVRVIIADKNAASKAALCAWAGATDGIDVVAAADDAYEAVRAARSLAADLILVGASSIPSADVEALLRPDSSIQVLAALDRPDARIAHASRAISKAASPARLREVAVAAIECRRVYPPQGRVDR